jgi:hypothetical protein
MLNKARPGTERDDHSVGLDNLVVESDTADEIAVEDEIGHLGNKKPCPGRPGRFHHCQSELAWMNLRCCVR